MSVKYDPTYIKIQNRIIVLNLLRKKRAISRVDLTKLTNMSFPTVIKVVDDLIEKGLIIDTETPADGAGSVGRKPRIIQFNPNAIMAIGACLEGNEAYIGLVNYALEIIQFEHLRITDENYECDLNAVVDVIREYIHLSDTAPIGIGMGISGDIDTKKNKLIKSFFFDGKKGDILQNLLDGLQVETGIPIYIENDVKTNCIGAVRSTMDLDSNDLIYCSLGTGFSCAIWQNDGYLKGIHNKAGGIGQTYLQVFTDSCAEPQMLEDMININAIKDRFGVDIMDSNLNEAQISRIVDYLVPVLNLSIFNLYRLVDINKFAIGGVIPEKLGDLFYGNLRESFQTMYQADVTILRSESGRDGVVGSADYAFEKLLYEIIK